MKKKWIIIGSLLVVVFFAISIGWTTYQTYNANKKNKKYGLSIYAEKETPTSAAFIIECDGIKSEDTLYVDDTMGVIEKKTLLGWKEMKHLRGGSFFVDTPQKCSIQQGGTKYRIELYWEYYYGALSKGTYRIKKGVCREKPLMNNEFVDYC